MEIKAKKDFKSLYIEATQQGYRPVSYSEINMYNNCNYSWQLKYIDKIKFFDQNINLIFGTAMHETIQNWLEVRYESVTNANKINLNSELNLNLRRNFSEAMQNSKPFTTKDEMVEYYNDGVNFLKYMKQHQDTYFPVNGFKLLGCEITLLYPSEVNPKVAFYGFIDIGIQNEQTDEVLLYDIKTSKGGWNDYKKKDFSATQQVLSYKEFYSKQYHVPIEKIRPVFFIVKRKLIENSLYPQKPIQVFEPASGKITMKKSTDNINDFIRNVFDENGNPIKKEYKLTENPNKCMFCDYKKNKVCPRYKD